MNIRHTLRLAALSSALAVAGHGAAFAAETSESSGGLSGTATRVENAVARGAHAAASGVEHGVKAAASGVERGAKATEHGLQRGAQATAHGVERGANATANAAKHVSQKISGPSSSSPSSAK